MILLSGWDRSEGVGAFTALRAQTLAGPAGLHGQEGRQDLRHWRRQGGGAGATRARRRRHRHRAAARAQREQLARASRAPQGREDVPPLQERRSAHQVSVEHDCTVLCTGIDVVVSPRAPMYSTP